MADKQEDNPPSLGKTHETQNDTSSTQMQDTVLIRMLTILQNIEQNQQKDRTDRGEQENKILGEILATQNKMLEMMMASHKREKTGERWREGSSETVTDGQDNTVPTTGHTFSAHTLMFGEKNKHIVNNNVRCEVIVYVLNNSDQSSSTEQSNSVETQLRNAFCDRINPLVQEMEQMLQAKLHGVLTGSIILVFLTANRNHFRKLFDQHELTIKCLMENYIKELSRGTKASYRIDIKIEDDNQDTGKDKSSKGISFTKEDNLHIEGKQSGVEDDDDDDDDDDDNNGAASANPYISGSLDEKRHEVMGKSKMHDSNDDLQNYDNNLDDKDNKDGKDYREMSIGRQFSPDETELDIIHRRDKVMSEEDILHSDRNHQRRKASKGNRSDDNTKHSGMCAKAKDSRGVQRGACKGCNECPEFDGYARCDYCNCAATQHTNLIHGSSNLDTTASASKMGNVHDPNGKDGRGIKRGKCSGCTECSEFRGDVRCDYCNCTATQHVNLTKQTKEKNSPSTFSKQPSENAKGKDGRGVKRGKCSGCTECSEFRGDVRCDYCNCAATQHFNCTHPSPSIDTSEHLPRTSQPGIDSRGVRRERCTSCKECSIFSGADRCNYCNCTATEHIRHPDHLKFTDPKTNTGITLDWSKYDLTQKVHASKKSCISSWTQDYTLTIRVRPHSQQPNGVSQTELQQQVNNIIRNNKMHIIRNVPDVFGAVFNDIRFENGCFIINMSINQLQRDAEIMLIERRKKIENYAKSLVKDIFPVQVMNLNWHRN